MCKSQLACCYGRHKQHFGFSSWPFRTSIPNIRSQAPSLVVSLATGIGGSQMPLQCKCSFQADSLFHPAEVSEGKLQPHPRPSPLTPRTSHIDYRQHFQQNHRCFAGLVHHIHRFAVAPERRRPLAMAESPRVQSAHNSTTLFTFRSSHSSALAKVFFLLY